MIPHISPVSIDPEEFPTGALGGLLGQAVREHHANSQAPLEVIAPSAVIAVKQLLFCKFSESGFGLWRTLAFRVSWLGRFLRSSTPHLVRPGWR